MTDESATATEVAPDLPTTTELQALEITRLKAELLAKSTRLGHMAALATEMDICHEREATAKAESKRWKEEAESLAVSMKHAALGTSAKDVPGQERLTDPDGNIVDPAGEDDPLDMGDRAPADSVAARIAAGDVLSVSGLDWSAVHRSALSALVSTGKPAKVKPVEIVGAPHVLVDVQQRTAVLYPLFEAETFVNKFGVEGAARPDDRGEELVALGPYAGIPVKVARKVMYLGAEPLLVVIPTDAAISTGAEPIPGPGSDLVANRIVAQLESAHTVAHMTADALSKILGVTIDVVRNAAKGSDRLVYEKDEDNEERVSRAVAQ